MSKKSSTILSNMFWNTFGSVYYQGCLWLLTVLVVRLSNNFQNSGYLALAMSIGNIMFALGSYNMRTYQVADVYNRFSFSTYIGFRLATDFASLAICLIYSFLICRSTSSFAICSAFILFKFDEAFVNVIYGYEQKLQRLDLVGKSYLIRGSFYLILFSIGLIFVQSLFVSISLMALCGILLTVFYDCSKVKLISGSLSLRPCLTKFDFIYLFKTCLPSVVALLISTFVVSGARQFFAISYGEEALGVYASVATPCVVIQVLAQNLYQPIIGPIAADFRSGKIANSLGKVKLAFLLVGGTGLFISISLSVFSKPLLVTLYGSSIASYVYLFFPVLIVSSLVACMGLLTDLLIVFGQMRLTLICNLIALVITMMVLPFACKEWCMNGINIALLAGFSLALAIGLFLMLFSLRGNR